MKGLFGTIPLIALLGAGCGAPGSSSKLYYPYTAPLNSPGTKFALLPQPVQQAIRAEAGTAEIFDIRRVEIPDRVVYKIIFSDYAVFPPLYVEGDGSVLMPDLRVEIPAESGVVKR